MVNTFLPSPIFAESARMLDYRRLGKQRVECMQILNVLEKLKSWDGVEKIGWRNHPATRMWLGHEPALKQYTNIMIHLKVKEFLNNTKSMIHFRKNTAVNLALITANQCMFS